MPSSGGMLVPSTALVTWAPLSLCGWSTEGFSRLVVRLLGSAVLSELLKFEIVGAGKLAACTAPAVACLPPCHC